MTEITDVKGKNEQKTFNSECDFQKRFYDSFLKPYFESSLGIFGVSIYKT